MLNSKPFRAVAVLVVVFMMLSATISIAAQTQPAGDEYSARRTALMTKIGTGMALIPSQILSPRGPQDDKDFYYLTGIAEPEAVLILWPTAEKREVYFNRQGRWPRTEGAAIDTRPLTELRMFLARSAAEKTIHLPFAAMDAVFQSAGGGAAFASAAGMANLDPVLAAMRIVKSAEEIEIIQKAVDITTEAYGEMLKAAQPGMTEIDLKAVLDYIYSRHEASSSFTQIASGPNSVNIHFGATNRLMKAGDVIVFDLGAWFGKNTSDISRTIPVGGAFTKEQKEIYEVVLEAQKEGIRLMTSGNGILKTQTAVEDALLRGLQKLGLVIDPASPWQRRIYIQHGFIHGIGLEVHDVWGWFSRQMRNGLNFQPGMALTMEPGLYFAVEGLDKAAAGIKSQAPKSELEAFLEKVAPLYNKYAGLGCRIEDDVLVLETGNRVLTARAPKEIVDIEKAMKASSPFNLLK
jgi:Xaa-Pro aminopeptidase